jgi:flagellar motor switch protein FliM
LIGQPLTIKVNHIPKFKAQAGKMGRKMAVQVLEKVTGGESDEQ